MIGGAVGGGVLLILLIVLAVLLVRRRLRNQRKSRSTESFSPFSYEQRPLHNANSSDHDSHDHPAPVAGWASTSFFNAHPYEIASSSDHVYHMARQPESPHYKSASIVPPTPLSGEQSWNPQHYDINHSNNTYAIASNPALIGANAPWDPSVYDTGMPSPMSGPYETPLNNSAYHSARGNGGRHTYDIASPQSGAESMQYHDETPVYDSAWHQPHPGSHNELPYSPGVAGSQYQQLTSPSHHYYHQHQNHHRQNQDQIDGNSQAQTQSTL